MLVLGSTSRYRASAPASYSEMRVASEQASGEKYRSMGASLAVWLASKAATGEIRGGRAEAPRSSARLSARDRARQGARPVPEGWFRRHLARRSQRRHRHESAEPLQR